MKEPLLIKLMEKYGVNEGDAVNYETSNGTGVFYDKKLEDSNPDFIKALKTLYGDNLSLKNDSRYYTPSEEEIGYGLDLETNNSNFSEDGSWVKIESLEKFYYYYDEGDIEPEQLRVKCLDRDDIEAEGWKKDSVCSWKLDDWYLEKVDGEIQCEIYLVADPRFNGTIRNRSELRRIMKQIGITK